jgi:serine/threonine protein kinase
MLKVGQILLRTYLRRNPVNIRLSQFNYLSQYSWLKNVLEELQPELFPDSVTPPAVDETPEESKLDGDRLLHHPIIGQQLRGLHGTYSIDSGYSQRGNSTLFYGTHLDAKRPVAIKVFEFSICQDQRQNPPFNQQEIQRRQQQFADQSHLKLTEGRQQNFRIPKVLDAIKDESLENDCIVYRCYLVTDRQACHPTLLQTLKAQGPFSPYNTRQALSQILQTLDFLHQQCFIFKFDQVQSGLIHGNLSLESILAINHDSSETFFYLTDLLLWERLFTTPLSEALPPIQANGQTSLDIKAAGLIGWSMLTGNLDGKPQGRSKDLTWPQVDVPLEQLLRKLIDDPQITAADARDRLTNLPPIYASTLDLATANAQENPNTKKGWSKPQLLGLLLAIAGFSGLWWTMLNRRSASIAQSKPEPVSCCLKEVSAVPQGEFTYATLDRSSWDYVLRQSNLMIAGQKLENVLGRSQQQFRLTVDRTTSIEETLKAVQNGDVDFAVVPVLEELPGDLVSQTIAYDGLAAVVHFSYGKRQQGLPVGLKGQISMEQLRQIFSESSENALSWKAFGGPSIGLSRSLLDTPETLALTEKILSPAPPPTVSSAEKTIVNNPSTIVLEDTEENATKVMLQRIINDFEDNDIAPVGRIGLVPLSQVKGQCSVYPLAIRNKKETVQPWLIDGKPITPGLDLCHRKGNYQPDIEAFRSGRYGLAYPIAVVYPNDNRRSKPGKKFAELLLTQEGQQLLRDAGLVMVRSTNLNKTSPKSTPATSSTNNWRKR